MPPATNKTAFAGTTEDVATVWGSFASSRVVLTAHFLDDSAAVLHQILWKGMHSQGVGDEGGGGGVIKGGGKERNNTLEKRMENGSELDQIKGNPNTYRKTISLT